VVEPFGTLECKQKERLVQLETSRLYRDRTMGSFSNLTEN